MLDGLLFALLAAVLFGVQYVPVKKYNIHDGTTFQWFMCSGILFVGLIGGVIGNELDHGLPPPVVFGGALWALSNFLVLPVVKLLGIGLGFSLYHFVNLIVGYVVGRSGAFGVPSLQTAFEGSLYLCDFGCGLILLSFVAMLLVEGQPTAQQGDHTPPSGSQPPPTVHGNAQEAPSPRRASCQDFARVKLREDALPTEAPSPRRANCQDFARAKLREDALPTDKSPSVAQQLPPHANGEDLSRSTLKSHEDAWQVDKSLLVDDGVEPTRSKDCEAEGGQARRAWAASLGPCAPGACFRSLPRTGSSCVGRPACRPEGEPPAATSSTATALGVLLAILAGGFAGVQSVPATLYSHAHPDYPSTAVVLPQCVGVWFASTIIYLLYSGVARLRKRPVRHAVIRPAFLSGCFWALGFSFMMKGIRALGFAVGYTLDAVGPVVVASLISICWFEEIAGRRQLCMYWSAEALQCVGVTLITVFSTGGE